MAKEDQMKILKKLSLVIVVQINSSAVSSNGLYWHIVLFWMRILKITFVEKFHQIRNILHIKTKSKDFF